MATWKKVLLEDAAISVGNITTDGTISVSALSDITTDLSASNHGSVELVVVDSGQLKTITADFDTGAFNAVTVNTDTVDMGDGFIVTADTNSNATTIVENETLTIAGGTNISTETTADGTVTINCDLSDTNTMGSGFVVTADTNSNATTIVENETLTIAGGTNISTETTADGTVTINCDLSDTNTMGSGFVVTADTNSNATTIVENETLTIAGGTNISTETTADGTVTINCDLSDTNTMGAGFVVTADTNSNATTIVENETLTIAGGTNISTETTADGTVTINCDLSDTNTMGSGFVVTADTNSNATTIVENETLTIAGGTGISTETTADGTVTVNCSVTNTDENVSDTNLRNALAALEGSTVNIGDAGDDVSVVIRGNLTVNGTTTTLDAANLVVEDKNIILGEPTAEYGDDALAVAGAAGGGITLHSDSSGTETDFAGVFWNNNNLTGWELRDAASVAETSSTSHPIAVMDFSTSSPISESDGTQDNGAGVGSFWYETDAKDLYIRVD